MARVLVRSAWNRDVICVPERAAKDLNGFRARFDAWLYGLGTTHSCRRDVNEGSECFRTLEFDGAEAFTRWHTEHVIEPGERAYVATDVAPDASMPELYF